jgi:hypothetical protein
LPAVNTPQFSWVKSRLPNHPQPVPPIYQPEVAAAAIDWAAHHRRRELTVGFSAVKAILGEKVIPGTLDHYLAGLGYDGQQTDWPADPDRPHNLWEPVPGDAGAHGIFDERAYPRSLQLWANMHAGWLTALAVCGGIAGVWFWSQRHDRVGDRHGGGREGGYPGVPSSEPGRRGVRAALPVKR